ncbi:steroid (22S)-hydroxylase-like [Carex rostrata]
MMAKNILSMEPGKPETEKIRREYTTFMPGTVSIPLKFPGTAYWKALKSRSVIYSEIGRKMNSRMMEMIRQEYMEGNNDMLCWCLTESKLSREQILDVLSSMLFGGFDTTSVALSLAIFFLGQCPKAFQELRDEHLGIARKKTEIGETKLNWEDYRQMEFTGCVVKETLRLGNVAKFVPRKAIQDVHYQGYDIPRGCTALPILSAAHLDGSIHENPQEFNPWRWQNKLTSAIEFMPFGGGNRMCAGAEIAKMELSVFLHHLVRNYRWELGKHDEPLAFPYTEFEDGLPIQVFTISKDAKIM